MPVLPVEKLARARSALASWLRRELIVDPEVVVVVVVAAAAAAAVVVVDDEVLDAGSEPNGAEMGVLKVTALESRCPMTGFVSCSSASFRGPLAAWAAAKEAALSRSEMLLVVDSLPSESEVMLARFWADDRWPWKWL